MKSRDWAVLAPIFGFRSGGELQDFALRAQARADIEALRRVEDHRGRP